MKKPLVISILLAIAPLSFAATHNLDGRTLTVDELWAISAPGEKLPSHLKAGQESRLLTKPRSMLLPTVVIFTV